jgi:CheY-like chemotaxis protein
MATHLIGDGFRVEIARTGSDALLKAGALKPVAITLDILLPELDGWEVLTRLKQDPATRDIPVVIASVVDNQGLGRALGAFDYFVKPVDRQALLDRLEQFRVADRRPGEPLRVLLIDDDPNNLDYLEAVLQPAGMAVTRASGGKEGIDTARAQLPDLVLLDLMMPEVTGFDVVEALRENESTRAIPIMVLTAKELTDEDKHQLNGFVAGVFERKSMAGAELIGWLHQLVGA